jgi:hypothetical protein
MWQMNGRGWECDKCFYRERSILKMEKLRKYKMKKDITVTDLSGEKVMIDYDSGKYFMIRGAGNAIWDLLSQKELTMEELVDALTEMYDVSREECEASTDAFLQDLEKYGFV